MIIPPQDYYSEYSSEQYSDGHPMYDDDIGGGGGGVPPELIGPLMEVMTGWWSRINRIKY